MSNKVGIVGSGIVGQTLANGFVKHGYDVMIGTNTASKREELKSKTNGEAKICTFESVDVVPLVDARRRERLTEALGAMQLTLTGDDLQQIERAVHWTGLADADAFVGEGVTLFTTEIHPTADGYDFGELKDMLAWRDRSR